MTAPPLPRQPLGLSGKSSSDWPRGSALGDGSVAPPPGRGWMDGAMARPGTLRHHKVLSSGRLTGAAKLASGKKQIGLRKACNSDVGSGYSLYSSDSEDQVVTIHNGLDRCAALLQDILQNEATGMETVNRKPGKVTSVKATIRPILAKGNSSKKKGLKRNILAAHIHKEIVPVSNRKAASCNTPAVDKEGELSSSVQNQPIQPIHVPFNQHSPVMHQKLCEHVQTQMSLLTGQVPPSCNGIPTVPAYPVSDPGYQSVTAFNYRLPTSTPSLSPQHSANPLLIQSGVPADSYKQCAPQAGGTVFFPGVSATASISSQAQSVTTGPQMTPCAPVAVPNNSTASTFLPAFYGSEVISNQGNHEQRVKEADLIRCIQAHLALLEPHEAESDRVGQKYQKFDPAQSKVSDTKEEETAEEHSEGTTSEEEDLNAVDIAPVRETSCQTSFDKVLKPKKASPEKTAQKVKTVKYLLGELKALADQDDSEILRLIHEVEDCVSLLPAVVGSTNVQAEIALAIQPLRSENAQLRRRLRILNQQLRERERAEKESSLDCNFELVSLQSLNTTLQSQLKESLKGLESLHNKNEELLKIIENQKEENKQFAKVIQEKDKELLENKQQYDIEATKLKIEVDEALANVKSFQFKLEASEKENQILGITLRQRDAEVNRLRELTRTLQSSMAKLLSDLTVDHVRHRPEKGLTKSLLEDYEKQLKPNPFPVSTSIMSYLKKLESDQILTNTELQFSNKTGELEMPGLACEKFVAEGSYKKSTLLAEEITAQRILPTLSKQDTETISDSGTLTKEEHKLDETIYIPLTSSVSKKQSLISERKMCAQHQVSEASKNLNYNCGLSDSQKQNGFGMLDDKKIFDKINGGYDLRKTIENTSETTGKTTELEGDKLLVRPKEITGTAKDFTDKSARPQSGKYLYTCMPHQKENFQKKGTEMSDSSFCTFDCMSGKSEWSMSSFSTFTSRDEEDFKNGLAALDANIARLQRTLQTGIMKQ
ncbi:coiled-coil domain-containing protein 14 isoform X2 [Chelonia mydas]|uniref:coiled-coil domain-containing protein 14 isoform X2 n=2 Tax=Chelonia mydas TaxID=8469 RepID=UPI001CA9270E|nr:coiled-coil domain-containing protein 14 isoform X2 [Chelonia mydas]